MSAVLCPRCTRTASAHDSNANAGPPNLFTLATGGILIVAVDPSSSAEAAGIAAGDVVTSISGSNVSLMSHAEAMRVLQVLEPVLAFEFLN
jgi:C-terminal processing protease CtpA/Prc